MSSYRFREFKQGEVLVWLQTLGGGLSGGRGQILPLLMRIFDSQFYKRELLSQPIVLFFIDYYELSTTSGSSIIVIVIR